MLQNNGWFLFFVLFSLCQSCAEEEQQIDPNLPAAMRAHLEDYDPPAYRWGYIDTTGQMVIRAKYDDARAFHQGYAAVSQGGLWGYIDRSGSWVVPPRYLEAYPHTPSGMKVMGANGSYGILQATGDTSLPFNYDQILILSADAVAIQKDGAYTILDHEGQPIHRGIADVLRIDDSKYAYLSDSTWYLQDAGAQRAKICRDCILYDDLTYIQDGQHFVYFPESRSVSSGYDEVHYTSGQYLGRRGRAYFIIMDGEHRTYQVPKNASSRILPLGENRLAMRQGGSWRLMHAQRGDVYRTSFAQIYPYENGLAPARIREEWGLIDTSGMWTVSPNYYLPWRPAEGIMRRIQSGGIGYRHLVTNQDLPGRYMDARDFSEGLAPVQPR